MAVKSAHGSPWNLLRIVVTTHFGQADWLKSRASMPKFGAHDLLR
jgi:hypothetical protein